MCQYKNNIWDVNSSSKLIHVCVTFHKLLFVAVDYLLHTNKKFVPHFIHATKLEK